MISHNNHTIKAIIGLGNPGPRYYKTRHSIGFRILDELAHRYALSWHDKENMEYTELFINNQKIWLIKPQTFMNTSGKVIPFLLKKGIKAENILVVHDELELPFSNLKFKVSGSHKGHNGLKSIIGVCGPDFMRLRFGIGRPERKEDVGTYVLQLFDESENDVLLNVNKATDMIEELLSA